MTCAEHLFSILCLYFILPSACNEVATRTKREVPVPIDEFARKYDEEVYILDLSVEERVEIQKELMDAEATKEESSEEKKGNKKVRRRKKPARRKWKPKKRKPKRRPKKTPRRKPKPKKKKPKSKEKSRKKEKTKPKRKHNPKKFAAVDDEKDAKFTDCCKSKAAVAPSCYNLCKFSALTKSALMRVYFEKSCPSVSIRPLLDCASSKKDHTACCDRELGDYNKGRCSDYCYPSQFVPGTSAAYISCLNVVHIISACFREGMD